MAEVRFLQISDLHLGRPFGWLPRERRPDRRFDQRRALESALKAAIERGADALLVPGDVFDAACVDAETLAYAVHDAFGMTGCPPVYIAPGNHDPCSETSHYWNEPLLRARGWEWPAHVRVFRSPVWQCVPLAGRDDVRIWGRCHLGGVVSAERPLAPDAVAAAGRSAADSSRDTLHVALFHGSREGFCPPGQKLVAPFSDAEALESPFDYLAVGHYHLASTLEVDGSVRLAYAGSPVALDVREPGAHGAWDVRITFGDGQPARIEAEFVELDRRRVFDLVADVSGCTSVEQVDRRIARALDQAGASDQDIVHVRLAGRITRGVRYAAPGPELRARAFHARIDSSGLRPDYDLDDLRAGEGGTTEERFVRAMVEQRDAESDASRRAEIEAALYYGIDAFRLGEVMPAYEDIAE